MRAIHAKHRVGRRSLVFPGRPSVLSTFTVAGPMEGQGPLGRAFDTVIPDTFYGERCWEQTESKMLREAIVHCIQAAGAAESDVAVLFT
ncbi:MAG: stage V sporulation protein AD, partial [Clostridia bacterium]